MLTRVMHPSCSESSPFKIYKDDTSTMSPSPHVEQSQPPFPVLNERYDADSSVTSTSEDEITTLIEAPNREFSDAYADVSSISPSLYTETNGTRKHSTAYTSVSSMPPSLSRNSNIKPYTPQKGPRAAFRSPSSVRALQMGSPPPFAGPRLGASPRRHDRYESGMTSPSSSRRYRPDTPSSLRSGSVMRQEYMESSQRSHESDGGTSNAHEQRTPQRTGPIVLLHITLLPCSSPEYSAKSMKELAPAYITENWRLLQEKLTDTVLERGLLISHPGNEFDLLEERVLETLDLCPPRITACGHYYGSGSDSDSGNDSGVADLRGDSKQVRAIFSSSLEEEEEEDVCHQCCQHMHLPGKGIGAGSHKWDVKIFAANGLMKAAAWSAACSDMERVDVEIEPWMPDDVKRALDARLEEEEEEERRRPDQVEHLKVELRKMEKSRYEAEAARLRAEDGAKAMELKRSEAEAARLRAEELAKRSEMMKLEAEAAKLQAEGFARLNEALRIEAEAARLRAEESAKEMNGALQKLISIQVRATEALTEEATGEKIAEERLTTPLATNDQDEDIALSTLLYNYLYLLTQDRRNLLLGFLSILVFVLSYRLVVPQSTSAILNLFPSHNTYDPSAQTSFSSTTSSLESPVVSPSSLALPASAWNRPSPDSIPGPESSETAGFSAPAPESQSTDSSQDSSVSIKPISEVSEAAVHTSTTPESQDASPDQDAAGKMESSSSSTCMYSPLASKASHMEDRQPLVAQSCIAKQPYAEIV